MSTWNNVVAACCPEASNYRLDCDYPAQIGALPAHRSTNPGMLEACSYPPDDARPHQGLGCIPVPEECL